MNPLIQCKRFTKEGRKIWEDISRNLIKIFRNGTSSQRGVSEQIEELITDFKWNIRKEASSSVIPKILLRSTLSHQMPGLVKIVPFHLHQLLRNNA